MTGRRDIWVDFNDVDRRGRTTTLVSFAEPDLNVTVGAALIAGDNDGNRCKAVVTDIGRYGVVRLTLDLAGVSAWVKRSQEKEDGQR